MRTVERQKLQVAHERGHVALHDGAVALHGADSVANAEEAQIRFRLGLVARRVVNEVHAARSKRHQRHELEPTGNCEPLSNGHQRHTPNDHN